MSVSRAAAPVDARLRAVARPWEVGLFGFAPLIVVAVVFFSELRWGGSLGDFAIFRDASKAILHGHNPYAVADPHSLAKNDKFVYPPITGVLFAPFAVIPLGVARVLMLLAVTLSIPIALRLLGVEDWRCYGLAILTAPFVDALSIGALTPFLLVGAALTWRLRDRPLVAGLAAAVTGVAKLFLWPMGVWLIVTRRIRTAAICVGAAVVLLFAGWAVIAFAGLGSYPHLLHVLSDVEAAESYSVVGLLGLSGSAAALVSLVLSAAVVVLTIAAARGADGDRRAFAVAVAGSVLVAPVLWIHYFVLLLVPLALFRPRLSLLWFLPLAFWATPLAHSDGVMWRMVVALLIGAAIAAAALRHPDRSTRSAAAFAPGAASIPVRP